MKVEINISAEIKDPYAKIYTDKITPEVERVVAACEVASKIVVFDERERMMVLSPAEVFMVRVEDGSTKVYTRDKCYFAKKRLYEVGELIGADFMQISKAAIVNLKELDYVEPYFSGMMCLKLKNGCEEFISRKFLPSFKKYLGI